MKTARPQFHLLWLLPAFLCFLALTSGVLHPQRVMAASFFGSDERAVTNVTRRAGLPADLKALEVDNRFGFVHVTATDSGPFDWEWNLTVKARNDDIARKGAAAVSFSVKTNAGNVRLTVELPNSNPFNRASFRSDLTIRVPRSAAIQSRNGFGETRITGLEGEVEAKSQHGLMEIRDAAGKVSAETSFGTLTVNNSGTATLRNSHGSITASKIRGPLNAETGFGSIKATDVGGAVVLRNQHASVEVVRVKGNADIKTSFGPLRAELIEGDAVFANQHGSIEARSVTGNVNAETAFGALKVHGAGTAFNCLNRHGSIQVQATSTALTKLEAKTSFGSLDVRLPDDFAPAIYAKTSFAQVESDFPILLPPRGQEPFANVEAEKPRIRLQNEHGGIRVTRGTSVTGR
jgi:DUF4097 and DUF4098 domain-containing protein YvlB